MSDGNPIGQVSREVGWVVGQVILQKVDGGNLTGLVSKVNGQVVSQVTYQIKLVYFPIVQCGTQLV